MLTVARTKPKRYLLSSVLRDTFQSDVSSPSSGLKNKTSKQQAELHLLVEEKAKQETIMKQATKSFACWHTL
jgi:hypothetical protein